MKRFKTRKMNLQYFISHFNDGKIPVNGESCHWITENDFNFLVGDISAFAYQFAGDPAPIPYEVGYAHACGYRD